MKAEDSVKEVIRVISLIVINEYGNKGKREAYTKKRDRR